MAIRTPRLLDLFCGVGGAGVGYSRVGFEVVGVDIAPQLNYPFDFVEMDALDFIAWGYAEGFDGIHASPPCQYYANLSTGERWRSIPATRAAIESTSLPYVIENIQSAAWDMRDPVLLCGSMFGLNVRRHRLFETSFPILGPSCAHELQREIRGYYGRDYGPALVSADAIQRRGRKPLFRGTLEQAPEDMGIDWATEWDELREAIPPAFTEYVGSQLMAHLAYREEYGI